VVRIWDVQSQTPAAALEGHAGRISSLAFSENGYHLAVTSTDNTVKLWDLRKLAAFKTITLGDQEVANAVAFDDSASYLAVGSTSVRCVRRGEGRASWRAASAHSRPPWSRLLCLSRIYVVKQWNELVHLQDHTGPVTSVAFGPLAKFLASAGMDRSLRISGV